MKKTKREFCAEAEEYAKQSKQEFTPSVFRKYLSERYHFSRATIYRIIGAPDDRKFAFDQERKSQEKVDELGIEGEEYANLVKRVFEYLHAKGIDSDSKLVIEDIDEIANQVGVSPRYIASNILGIRSDRFDELKKGKIKTVAVRLGLGFKDDEMAKKVEIIKNKMINERQGETFTVDDIEKMSQEFDIPEYIILKHIFFATETQIRYAMNNGKIEFNDKRPFVDYPYNKGEMDKKTRIFRMRKDITPAEFDTQIIEVISEEDRFDSIVQPPEFYMIEAQSREEFMEKLVQKKRELKERQDELTEKYDEKYMQLVDIIRNINAEKKPNGEYPDYIIKKIEPYIEQLKQCISRNPRFSQGYPLKLKFRDFLQISDDVHIDPNFLAYKMFRCGPSIYGDKTKELREGKQPYFEIETPPIPPIPCFFELFNKEYEDVARIATKIVMRKYGDKYSLREDIHEAVKEKVYEGATTTLFYHSGSERIEDYLPLFMEYSKKIAEASYHTMKPKEDSLDESIENRKKPFEDGGKTKMDTIAASSTISILSSLDEADQGILYDIYDKMNSGMLREKAIAEVAKEMGIPIGEMKRKLASIQEEISD